jgi:hypothetical protein
MAGRAERAHAPPTTGNRPHPTRRLRQRIDPGARLGARLGLVPNYVGRREHGRYRPRASDRSKSCQGGSSIEGHSPFRRLPVQRTPRHTALHCVLCLIHDVPFFPTALWPLPIGRESFGRGRREPLPHGRSCQRPPVPDPPEDENKAPEHSKPCRRVLGWQTMNGEHRPTERSCGCGDPPSCRRGRIRARRSPRKRRPCPAAESGPASGHIRTTRWPGPLPLVRGLAIAPSRGRRHRAAERFPGPGVAGRRSPSGRVCSA